MISKTLNEKSKAWWRSQRTYGLSQAIRQETQAKEIALLAARLQTPSGVRKVKKLLREATTLEQRVPA